MAGILQVEIGIFQVDDHSAVAPVVVEARSIALMAHIGIDKIPAPSIFEVLAENRIGVDTTLARSVFVALAEVRISILGIVADTDLALNIMDISHIDHIYLARAHNIFHEEVLELFVEVPRVLDI